MIGPSLLDAFALLFVVYRIARANGRPLGESLHTLLALMLVVGLFLGFRMTREVRAVLGEAVDLLQAIPGLGTKLLVIVGAWLLLRLLRRRSGEWLENAIPRRLQARILPVTEGVRAVLLAGLIAWLAEGFFDGPPQTAPKLVRGVRLGDAWIAQRLQPASQIPSRAGGS